jgi:hypothetical protein
MKKLLLIFVILTTVFAGYSSAETLYGHNCHCESIIFDGLGLMLQAPSSGPTSRHLTGEPAIGDDMIDGLATTVSTVLPFTKVATIISSPSTITNIMKSGKGVPDAYFKGGMNYKVPGSFNGSQGIFEVGINPQTNTIYHFLFKTVK